jgi:hypothetical protein
MWSIERAMTAAGQVPLGYCSSPVDSIQIGSKDTAMSQNTSAYTPDHQAFLLEYEKAQDSAEHHDSLGWTSVSFVFDGMLVLLGFALGSMEKQEAREVLRFVGWFVVGLPSPQSG